MEDLRRVAELAVDEVVEDAIKLLELYHRLKRTPARTEAHLELEAHITALRIHAQS